MLVQKMAVNVDLGFILALVDFFSLSGADSHIEVSTNFNIFPFLSIYYGHFFNK